MSIRFPFGIVSFLIASAIGFGASEARANVAAFPNEAAYQALYSQAMNKGYPDVAQGVAVFREYRSGIQKCAADQNSPSAKAFGAFLDSVVYTFTGYINSSNLRNRGVRNSIVSYVTECSALIETYARQKAKHYNGSATRLDAQDEKLVATTRRLHAKMTGMLRAGAPSLSGAVSKWERTEMSGWVRDGRFGKAAEAVVLLASEKAPYCSAI